MLQFQEKLTGSTKFQGINGYFCDNVLFNIVNVTITYELPSYPIQRKIIIVVYINFFVYTVSKLNVYMMSIYVGSKQISNHKMFITP